MTTTTSKDGTRIAFDKAGQGAAVIFTVITYHRRDDSGNTLPYAVEREVEEFFANGR